MDINQYSSHILAGYLSSQIPLKCPGWLKILEQQQQHRKDHTYRKRRHIIVYKLCYTFKFLHGCDCERDQHQDCEGDQHQDCEGDLWGRPTSGAMSDRLSLLSVRKKLSDHRLLAIILSSHVWDYYSLLTYYSLLYKDGTTDSTVHIVQYCTTYVESTTMKEKDRGSTHTRAKAVIAHMPSSTSSAESCLPNSRVHQASDPEGLKICFFWSWGPEGTEAVVVSNRMFAMADTTGNHSIPVIPPCSQGATTALGEWPSDNNPLL
jgi:hypothetical protein